MSARCNAPTWGSRFGSLQGLAPAFGCLVSMGCMFIEDPGETHPAPVIEPSVLLYHYSLEVAESGESLANGCGASRGGNLYEADLEIAVPLEEELIYEERLVGRHEGTLEDTGQDYYCKLGPTTIGVGSAFRDNPKCYSPTEAFEARSYELIGYEGESVDWESDNHDWVSAIGLRVHLIQHDYGIVGVRSDSPPCAGGSTKFYMAIPLEEEEE